MSVRGGASVGQIRQNGRDSIVTSGIIEGGKTEEKARPTIDSSGLLRVAFFQQISHIHHRSFTNRSDMSSTDLSSSSHDFLESSAHLVAWPGTPKPLSIETLIAKMCAEFVRRETKDVDAAINLTLEQLVRINNVSRCYILEFKPGQTLLGQQTHEWILPGLTSRMPEFQAIPLADFMTELKMLRDGMPLAINDIHALSPEHKLSRPFQDSPTRSVLLVPMIAADQLIGVIGLSANHPVIWQPQTIQLLTIVGEMIAGALEKRQLDQKLESRLRFEKFIAELGVNLIHSETEDLDAKIKSSIGFIGEYLEADRCYIMMASKEKDLVNVTHEWTRDGIPAVIDKLQQIPIGPNSYTVRQLDQGKVVTIPDVETLPPEAESLKLIMRAIGTKASAYFPMMYHEKWIGSLGVAFVRTPRSISPDDLSLLVLITQMFVNAFQRKEMEDKLRASEQRFRLMLEAITEYGYDWDIPTGNVFYTRRSLQSARPDRQEYNGSVKDWCNSIHPDDFERVQKVLNDHLEGRSRFYEVEYRMKYVGVPDYRWVLDRGMVVQRNDKGEPIRFLGAELDVHDSRQIQEERERLIAELASKNQELEQFTYTVSHDLKSPLITISGFLGVLKEDLKSGNEELIHDAIAEIQNATVKMRLLLDQLLDLSRIGRISGKIVPIAIHELVSEALRSVDGPLKAKSIQVDLQPLPGTVEGDRVRLQEVFQNVFENAIKFCSPTGGRICVSAIKSGGDITISIRDNGIGIDPVYHEKIFGLFEKLDPMSEGTGIGLSLCKRIIEHHGGKIWVESTGVGRGTSMKIRLKAISGRHDKTVFATD